MTQFEHQVETLLAAVKACRDYEHSMAERLHSRLNDLLVEGRSGTRRRSQGWSRHRMREARSTLCKRFKFPKGDPWKAR